MLLTYGHGTEPAERTTDILREAGVSSLVDIRTAPGSRRNPQFARAALEEWLPAAGIAYRWEKRLGGFRRPSPDNPDVVWREDMFRGYAEHMRSPDFLAAIDAVLAEAELAEAELAEAGAEPETQRSCARRACGGAATAAWWRTSPRSPAG
jgi:uncharacterized protein (DUF488 family)